MTPRAPEKAGDGRELASLRDQIARATARLDVLHADRLRCGRGCSECCVDDLTVFEVEAEAIRRHHATLLSGGRPHPEGACAFLDGDGACRIYDQRPYVCRTQGYPLRWLDEAAGDAIVEYRDICPLNDDGGPPVETMPAEQCWTLGPIEARLAELQRARDGGAMRRVRLRDLFGDAAAPTDPGDCPTTASRPRPDRR